jgi:hypothetical protein
MKKQTRIANWLAIVMMIGAAIIVTLWLVSLIA